MGPDSAAQAAFARDGYLALGPLLAGEELARLDAAFDGLVDRAAQSARFPSREALLAVVQCWVDPWRHDPAFAALRAHEAIVGAARALLGVATPRLVRQQLVVKAPRATFTIPWHQDRPTLPIGDGPAVVLWLALDDVDEGAGALRYVPGSHRDSGLEAAPVTLETARGEALAHHPDVWHASAPNRGPTWRRAVIHVWEPAP